jgi:hypothetical protein
MKLWKIFWIENSWNITISNVFENFLNSEYVNVVLSSILPVQKPGYITPCVGNPADENSVCSTRYPIWRF